MTKNTLENEIDSFLRMWGDKFECLDDIRTALLSIASKTADALEVTPQPDAYDSADWCSGWNEALADFDTKRKEWFASSLAADPDKE